MLITNMSLPMQQETVWFDKYKFDDAERHFYELNAKQEKQNEPLKNLNSIVDEIASARDYLRTSISKLGKVSDSNANQASSNDRILNIENDTCDLKRQLSELRSELSIVVYRVGLIAERVAILDNNFVDVSGAKSQFNQKEKKISLEEIKVPPTKISFEEYAASTKKEQDNEAVDDDDLDLFGSDEEDPETTKFKEERVKAYAEKKAKKAPVIAKSSVVLDVKPWDDETDLNEMEKRVREVISEGLVWGASKQVPLAFGIKKLQIVAVVEDDKVSIDWLQETIQETIEDLVQSVDIAAFNKL